MIKLKDLIIETWNSNIWPSNLWNSDIWNSEIWPSHIWENETDNNGFSEKRFFGGDCRTILNTGTLFSDATEMAQAIENSKSLTKMEFIDKIAENSIPKKYKLFRTMLSRNPNDFEFGEGNGFVFAYDTVSDIHYFFI